MKKIILFIMLILCINIVMAIPDCTLYEQIWNQPFDNETTTALPANWAITDGTMTVVEDPDATNKSNRIADNGAGRMYADFNGLGTTDADWGNLSKDKGICIEFSWKEPSKPDTLSDLIFPFNTTHSLSFGAGQSTAANGNMNYGNACTNSWTDSGISRGAVFKSMIIIVNATGFSLWYQGTSVFENTVANSCDQNHPLHFQAIDDGGSPINVDNFMIYNLSDPLPSAPTISDLYDVTGAGNNKTNGDTTPTINLTTDINAKCNISIDNSTWFSCSTTGATGHVCTVNSADPLSIGYPQNVTVNCTANSLSNYATIQYNITDIAEPNSYKFATGACYDNVSLGDCFAINWSKAFNQINWSDNVTIHSGNYSWNFSEYNITSIGNFMFNITNNRTVNVTFGISLNQTSQYWDLFYRTNETYINLTSTDIIYFINVTANTTEFINLSFNVYNISQRYVNWTLDYSTADWAFNYTREVRII